MQGLAAALTTKDGLPEPISKDPIGSLEWCVAAIERRPNEGPTVEVVSALVGV